MNGRATRAVPSCGRSGSTLGNGGRLAAVTNYLTRRRAVDFCRVDSSLCQGMRGMAA